MVIGCDIYFEMEMHFRFNEIFFRKISGVSAHAAFTSITGIGIWDSIYSTYLINTINLFKLTVERDCMVVFGMVT